MVGTVAKCFIVDVLLISDSLRFSSKCAHGSGRDIETVIDVIVITFYSPSCLGQETAKGPFGLRDKLPPVYHTRRRLHTVPLIAEHQAGKL